MDEGINCEIVRSVLMERANCPYLAAQTATEVRCYVPLTNPPQSSTVLPSILLFLLCGHLQMEAFSRTDTFPKVVEVYSRPTRIIRGKEIESVLEVLA